MRAGRRVGLGATALAAILGSGAVFGFSGGDPGPGPSADAVGSGEPAQEAARPAHWPDRFGFGTPASEARIAEWDIDVKPDGEGLPPGSGTVAEGQRVYGRMCRSCHGATGVEGPNDRLVGTGDWDPWPPGRAVGVYWPYATTLFDYISKAMPQKRPGTLTAEQTYAVIAYILNLNGIVDEDAVMSAQTLPVVVMPARDRFVPDDRTGGPVIR
jgi:mono/diheme cytochrome c family protein